MFKKPVIRQSHEGQGFNTVFTPNSWQKTYLGWKVTGSVGMAYAGTLIREATFVIPYGVKEVVIYCDTDWTKPEAERDCYLQEIRYYEHILVDLIMSWRSYYGRRFYRQQ
ncbi:hypothetical protein KAZ57_03605 [Patescibacteria group bacterium]|nr:hypothetical protein [Patescibacteria group bacterium]